MCYNIYVDEKYGGMAMRKKYQYFILLAAFCVLCMIPKTVSAVEKEYDLNKKDTVTISKKNSYGASGNHTWLRYKPSADGYLTIKMSDPKNAQSHASGYIALFNQTKQTALSSKAIFYNTEHAKNAYWNKFVFGVQKGQTYYLRIQGENAVKITRKFTITNDQSGATRETARNLKAKAAVKGLIPAGVFNADWYKIHLTKRQRISFYYDAKVSGTGGSFKVSVYSGTKLIASRNLYYTSGQRKFNICRQNKTTKKMTGMEAGTYYVKIERANVSSSGFYKFKWN